jgi:hypothetical protein
VDGGQPRRAADGSLTVVIDGVYDLADIPAANARGNSVHEVGNIILHP